MMACEYNGSILKNVAEKKWAKAINSFFESNAFIAVLAFLVLFCNVFGAEFFVYTLVISYGIYLCLLGRDMRSIAAAVPFMYLSPSRQNNPAANPNSIFTFANGLWFIILYLLLFLSVLTVRIVLNKRRGLFVGVKWKLFTGLVCLSFAFLLGGTGQPEYTFSNLIYSVLLILSLGLLYFVLVLLVDWKTVRKDYFAWIGMFMGLIVAFEVLNIYMLGEVIDENGVFNVAKLFSGWGVSTNIAGVLMCAIPGAFFLVFTKERPLPYILAATFIYIMAVFTGSRNGILIGGMAFVASAVIALKPKENRRKKLITYAVIFAFCLVLSLIFYKITVGIFKHLLTDGVLDFGRLNIYTNGLNQFLASPILGKGFFACNAFSWGTENLTMIPPRWHCTIVQMLASCGIVGAITYAYHRYQTVKLLLENFTKEKLFIALSIAVLLLSSLVDCFLFNIGPGLFYSVMLAFLEKSDEMQPKEYARISATKKYKILYKVKSMDEKKKN